MAKTPETDEAPSTPPVTLPMRRKTAPVAAAPTIKKVKPQYVRIENKMKQPLVLSIVNDDGVAEELKVPALATSPAVRKDRLTPAILRLADRGQVRIR